MAYSRGVDGAVYYGGEVLRVTAFTLNMGAGVEDVTDFGSSGVEREYTGVVDVSGSFSGQFQLIDTSTGGAVDSPMIDITQMFETSGTLAKERAKFIETTKSMWWGNILVTGFSKSNSPQSLGQVSFDFVGDGRMIHTSSTST